MTADANLLLTGSTTSNNSGDIPNNGNIATSLTLVRPWVIKVNPNGNIIWSKMYPELQQGRVTAAAPIKTRNGTALAGLQGDNSGKGHTWGAVIDKNGNLLWNYQMPGDFNGGNTVGVMPGDNGFVVGAYGTSTYGSGDFWLIRFN